ncbi:MAG: hypothetical protein HRU38_09600 [Saccharospirillaceae bacterium]|nr:hypothetical protein [Pseudomonadales bacterium]NRB78906.1 hypothetical protein [Saccharospirillaceae bacterium]
MSLPLHIQNWFIPISEHSKTLGQAFKSMQANALAQNSIPLIIQLVENPKYEIPGLEFFSGSTDLITHDYIHLLLGRGLLPKDEAFVLGFTMGSTNRVSDFEAKIYGLFSKFIYPKEYRFTQQDFEVYKDAVRLGFISDCKALNKIQFEDYLNYSLPEARTLIGIEESLLHAYYKIEKHRYPNSIESQRLLQ